MKFIYLDIRKYFLNRKSEIRNILQDENRLNFNLMVFRYFFSTSFFTTGNIKRTMAQCFHLNNSRTTKAAEKKNIGETPNGEEIGLKH
ncbi:CLUMA_CG009000, isoform A [Clunio marinus]|uniref:CLUMA_CG009000, isoform A n=1 Tax=Clunio marinus TaxID=568069 RepID=A0A1J1I5S2_9DIPT|nr:CLUMA_CG009000, isoform A [Clunio marinus]